ncbi:MAG: amino acid permease [Bacteroidia bacterium]|nr:amino acid permease [Bacteroidia bacterium]
MSGLKQKLSLFDLTMIAVGSTIGSGIFLTPAEIATDLPAPFLIMAAWALGGLIALTGALTYAELGTRLPQAGGVYVYLREGFGPLTGFLYGWANLTVINTGSIAALAVAFSYYLGYLAEILWPGLEVTGQIETVIAISGIVLVTLVNLPGVKTGGWFSNLFTVLKLLGILGLIVIGLGLGEPGNVEWQGKSPEGGSFGLVAGFFAALVGVFWSYGGWQHASYLAGEAKNAARNVPRAMVIGALIITATYLLTNLAFFALLPVNEIAGAERVAATAAERILGTPGGILIAGLIFLSTFGTTGIYTLTAPRIYWAMAQDGIFFKGLAQLHPRFGTPVNAILIQSALAIVLILAWGTFGNLIKYVVFTDWIFITLAAITIFIFRRREPNLQLTYRTPLYPAVPLFFIGVSTGFIVATLISEPVQALAGLGLLGLGALAYLFWKKQEN